MKRYLYLIFLFYGFLTYAIFYEGIYLVDHHIAQTQKKTEAEFENSLTTHYKIIKLTFDQIRSDETVLELVKNNKRDNLYLYLLPTFESLQKLGVVQLHFHSFEGKSFLRFHKPETYGDSLLQRKMISRMLKEKNTLTGYEVGRFLEGFRYIVPLYYQGEYIGSLGVSISASEILSKPDGSENKADLLIVKKKNLDEIMLPYEIEQQFAVTCLDAGFYIHKTFKKTKACENTLNRLKKLLVSEALQKERPFVETLFIHNLSQRLVTFVPLKDISGEVIGYHISIREDKTLLGIYLLQIIKFITLTLLVVMLVYMVIRSFKNSSINEELIKIIDTTTIVSKTDKKGIINYVNSKFCEVSGYRKEELLGKSHNIIRHPDMPNTLFSGMWKTILKGKVWHGKVKNITKNGQEYVVQAHIVPIMKNGLVKEFLAIRHDITDIEKYKEKLQNDLMVSDKNFEEAIHFSTVYQNAISETSIVTRTDLQGHITYANKAFLEASGFTQEEVLGKTHNIIRHPDNTKEYYEEFWNTVRDGKAWSATIKNRRKDGKTFYEKAHVYPIKNSHGKIIEYLEVCHDITDIIELEKQVKSEMEKNLENEKKHQEEKLLQGKYAAIGTLAAGITHEINTPLTFIKGNIELLEYDVEDIKDETLRKTFEEGFDSIKTGIKRITTIISNMKEIASREKSEKKEKVNVFKTLGVALTMLYNRSKIISEIYLQGERFELGKKINKTLFIHVQPQRLEQVWIVIVNNALDELEKIDPFEKRRIDVNVYEHDDDVVITFSDNAGGIDESLLDKIFEPFSSTKESKGMGVGLNIAKKIIDDQGGEIFAFNTSEGAIFRVHLKKVPH